MRQISRLRAGSFSLLALCITTALLAWPASGSAASGTGPVQNWDPQTTNVPYLGWAGEEIRLEKCLPLADGVTADRVDLRGIQANFLVEDWSGTSSDPNDNPQIEPSTVKLFFADGEFCAEGDAVSLYPGMARIELDIVDNTGQLGYDPASPVLKHQFLAGWMTLNDPSLHEMAATDFTSTAQAEAAAELGDPSGNGEFNAGGGSGYLDVKVTGSMPINADWQNLGLPATITLPNDWVTLAHALATDNNPADTTPWTTWDTSGDSTGLEGHVTPTPPCSAVPSQFAGVPVEQPGPDSYTNVLDNVDNCTGGGPDGPFSRVFGDLSGDGTSIGPFDPLDPADTLLPDGNLSSQDAPMPAARIDVSIAPNSGGATDISGVGSLIAADKTKTYSRDFLGDDGVPDNLYAPFYDAYLPATARGPVSSGVDGGYGNNFPGFLNTEEPYHFWDIAATLASNSASATDCLERSADPETDTPTSNPGDYFQSPSGDSSVAVYTDQNGEAQVQYVPGTGFYFNSLINNGGALLNADGGCDLQSLYQVPDSLGTSSITATARYPFKPVDFPAETSSPVTKSVTSLWSKTLAYFPKGTGAANNNSRIVVAHAQNIDGTPFAGEVVCFSADGESMDWFNGTVGPYNLGGTSLASDPKGGSSRVCVTTDDNGNAAVEVLESNPISVDVIADFTNEGILRDITVNYATSGTTGGTPPPVPSGSGAGSDSAPATNTSGGNTGTTTPSITLIKQVAPSLLVSSPAISKADLARIMLVRLVSPAHGQHYVLIRVKSGSANAKVLLRLISAAGHTTKVGTHKVRTTTRSKTFAVKTNRNVRINVASSVLKLGRASLVK
jgi:hypothetical protein